MKKILIVLLSLSMVLSLTACGVGSENSTSGKVQASIPKYSVQIKLECIENLLFSKYDIDIYVDDTEVGTLEHGATDTFEVELEEGTYTLTVTKQNDSDVNGKVKFTVSEDKVLHYKLTLSSSQVKIEEVVEEEPTSKETTSLEPSTEKSTTSEEPTETTKSESKVTESVEDTVLTVDNCADLAAILATRNESDPLIKEFADKYKGRTIEFDGSVYHIINYEKFKTRYDILIGAGDYDINSMHGPYFQFENVDVYALGIDTTLYMEDVIKVGKNYHIVAVVGEYNPNTDNLFKLKPISVEAR